MITPYRIFGSEMSPYSVKVRSYFRYKAIPHVWTPRGPDSDEDYKRFAKLAIVPTVATPANEGLQDSTPILERLEAQFPEPSIHPADPTLSFLSALFEEFGDEWGNKLMFHHRWFDEIDAKASALTLARLSMPTADDAAVAERAAMIVTRMTGRGHFVGSSPATAPLICDYLVELLDLLEAHLKDRAYLFGARPSFGDFGLAAQLYEASVDPTCGGIIRARASKVLDWCYRMNEPRNDGPFETWETLAPTMMPLLAYVGRYFLPWTDANSRALQAAAAEFTVQLAGRAYGQPPQKYHAKSLAALRAKRAGVLDARLDAILAETDCAQWLGTRPSISHAHRLECVADISRLHARERPNAVALDFRDRLTTYAELDERASRVANGLLAMDQKPGARIGYVGKNLDRFWDVVLGTFKSRTVIVGLNWRLAAPELAFVIGDADCEFLFVGADFYGVVDQILSQLPQVKQVVAMDGGHPRWPDYETWCAAQSPLDPHLASADEDDILQVYTSGTTGLPKGVRLNNANYLSLFRNHATDVDPYGDRDVILIAMPFFHVAGVNMGMSTLANGSLGVILPEVDPKEILRLIPAKGITQATLVPAVIMAVTQQPEARETNFSTLKRITYGGSPIPEAVLRDATTLMGCGFMQAYGLTETTGGPITYLPPADHDPARGKLRSCGRAAPGREIKVVDAEGRTLPPRQVGEILMRATCVMKGYWKRDESNIEAFDAEGFFRSGDAGYFDDEGYLYIHDRMKEMIVSGGENIYPAEVENAIAGHPAVQDVAVIGVPDDRWGEAVKAIIACKPGMSADAAEIIAYARERIAGYKLPKSVDFVASIPRNASGKILRRDLRQPYWEGRDRQVN